MPTPRSSNGCATPTTRPGEPYWPCDTTWCTEVSLILEESALGSIKSKRTCTSPYLSPLAEAMGCPRVVCLPLRHPPTVTSCERKHREHRLCRKFGVLTVCATGSCRPCSPH